MFTGGLGAHYGIERASYRGADVGQPDRSRCRIMDFKPEGHHGHAVLLAGDRRGNSSARGIAPEDISLQIGVFGAEPWGEGMRAEIEKKLGIDAIDICGLTEVMGGRGLRCIETKDGPVIWEDHFYPGSSTPRDRRVLPDGEQGASWSSPR